MNKLSLYLLIFWMFCDGLSAQDTLFLSTEESFHPLHYTCFRTTDSIQIDGLDYEQSWKMAAFSASFIDIEGQQRALQNTRVKMLWDDTYLYIYALLNEQHIWASISKRDAVIFHDNDFEVFIDPSDNTYDYTEIEINALNTVWDLKLNKPYRMKGWANTEYNIEGLKTAVAVQGTLNDASDIDTSWSVEMAIPLQALQATFRPSQRLLGDNVMWRINFSRVQWKHRIENGNYSRKKVNGKLLTEYNWVWSPQHFVNMHIPEKWGYLHFSTNLVGASTLLKPVNSALKTTKIVAYALLRRVKYGPLKFLNKHTEGFLTIFKTQLDDIDFDCHYLKTHSGFQWKLLRLSDKKIFIIDELGNFQKM